MPCKEADNSTQPEVTDVGANTSYDRINISNQYIRTVKSAVKSYLTAWFSQNLFNAFNALTLFNSASINY